MLSTHSMGRTTTIIPTKKVTTFKGKEAPVKLGRESAASRVLGACVVLEKRLGRPTVPRQQVVIFACVKSTSELCVLSKLKMEGLILYTKNTIQLTDDGRSLADHSTIPRDNRTHHAHLKDKFLTGVLTFLFEAMADGKVHDRLSLCRMMAGLTEEETLDNLSKLKKMGFIEYPDQNSVQLTDVCFPFGRP